MSTSQSTNLGSLYRALPENPYVSAKTGKTYKHKVPARDERRALVRVTVAPSNGCAIGGQHVPAGTHEIVIYRSELDEVRADTASADQLAWWKSCEDQYRSMLAVHCARETGIKPGQAMTEKDRAAWERAEESYGETTPSRLFAQRYPLGMPPIAKLEVLEDDVPAPETDTTRERDRFESLVERFTDAMVRAAASAGGKKGNGG